MSRIRLARVINRGSFYTFFSIGCFVYLIPLFFILFMSVKSPAELFSVDSGLFSFPKHMQWANYVKAWVNGNIGLYMKNSAIVTLIQVPLTLFVTSVASFALTRLRFRPSNIVFLIFLVGLMMPLQIYLVPLMVMVKTARLQNTIWSLIFPYIALAIPFGILVFRGYFRTIPFELDNSAKIDGCSNFQIYRIIIMPLSKPAISTMVIILSLDTWNEFLLASLFVPKDSVRTLQIGLLSFVGEWTTDYPVFMAAILLSIIPVFVVYLFFQQYFVQGLAGTLKE
jgi:raffinose/stachyose/melibiose transport system permease protein